MPLYELATHPATSAHPGTEVVIVVDDGAHVDAELLAGDGGDWVVVSDEVAVDDHRRDELLEQLQARAAVRGRDEDDDEAVDDEEDSFAAAGFEESEGYPEE